MLTLEQALAIFHDLEEERYEDPGYDDGRLSEEPIYNVRLDAYTERQFTGGDRRYRIRVTMGGQVSEVDAAFWERPVTLAKRYGCSVRVANDGMEIWGA